MFAQRLGGERERSREVVREVTAPRTQAEAEYTAQLEKEAASEALMSSTIAAAALKAGAQWEESEPHRSSPFPIDAKVMYEGQLERAQRAAPLDQNAQEPSSMWKVSDLVSGGLIDARIDEASKKPIITHNPNRRVTRPQDLPRDVCDALEDGVDIEL